MENDPFDIYADDLPEELIGEISTAEDLEDRKIVELFRMAGRPLHISEVLVGYYRVNGEVKSRRYMTSKLYRMSRKGLLESTDRKGEYALKNNENQTEEDDGSDLI